MSDARSSLQPRRPAQVGRIEKARDPRGTLSRLLLYLSPYGFALTLVLILTVAATGFALSGPYLMGRALDRFIGSKDIPGLAGTAMLMIGAYVSANVLNALTNRLMAGISQRALKQIRTDLFSRLQSLPLRFFDTHGAGELMSRLTSDIDAINQAVSQNVTALLTGILTLSGILVAMFLLNPLLALATLVVVPILFAFTGFVARFTRKGFRELQKHLGEMYGKIEEAVSGQRVVRSFRRGDSVLEAFREKNEEVFRAGVYANSYALLLMPLTAVLGNLFVIVLAGFGGWLALRSLVSVGTIAAFINYGQNFIQPLRQLANLYNAVQSALAGAERVFEILDTPEEPPTNPGIGVETGTVAANGRTADAVAEPPGVRPPDFRAESPASRLQGRVEFRNVRFAYVPGTRVITDMSLSVEPGKIVALVGPTGAGKTTIINLLTRFYEIDSGSILIDGRDIRTVPLPELRSRLGLVLQDTFLFSGTVTDNIRYGRLSAADEECVGAALTADADHFIRQLPSGYDTLLSERAGNLSKGQRQLLSIARAVLADPSILILDEATSSVDTRTESRIQKALLALMKGRTSFVIAHRLSTIRDVDLVAVIRDGRIAERGTHEELMEKRGFYHSLVRAQYAGREI